MMSYALTSYHSLEMNPGKAVTSMSGSESRGVTVESCFVFRTQSLDPTSVEVGKAITISIGLFFIPLIALLGVPGNIVSAVVFYRQGLRARINLCLFALAIVDLVVVLVLLFTQFESQIRDLFLPHAWFFTTKVPCPAGFVWASQLLSAVIASERCFCVVSPFHAKRLLKTSTMAAIIVVCCFILVGGMCAIAGPKHTVVDVFDSASNTSKELFSVTKFYLNNKEILDIFDIFVYASGLAGIFFLVIVVTTVITIISLRSAVSQRQNMTRANDGHLESSKPATSLSSKEVAVTRMLIGTSILFIICLTPNFMVQITSFIVPDLSFSGRYSNTNLVMRSLIAMFRVISCSVNICVYYALGSKFRQSLKKLCVYHGCKRCKIYI